jgi:hypothetical protein
MTFAQIAGTPVDTSAAAATAHTLNLPSGITAGEKLLVVIATRLQTADAFATFDSLSFNTVGISRNGTAQVIGVYERTAAGTEGTTTSVTLGVSAQINARVWRISNAQAIEGTAANSASNTTIDPPALNPAGWDVEDTLWFTFVANNVGTMDITGFPANYTTGKIFSNASGRPTLGYGYRELAAASEDPGVFTFDAASPASAATVAVQPTAAAGWSGRTPPDAILGSKGYSGTLADIDEDPDSGDASWLTSP